MVQFSSGCCCGIITSAAEIKAIPRQNTCKNKLKAVQSHCTAYFKFWYVALFMEALVSLSSEDTGGKHDRLNPNSGSMRKELRPPQLQASFLFPESIISLKIQCAHGRTKQALSSK